MLGAAASGHLSCLLWHHPYRVPMQFNIPTTKLGTSLSPRAERLTRLWVRLTDLNSSAWIGVICLGTLQTLVEPAQAIDRPELPPDVETEQTIPSEPDTEQSVDLADEEWADEHEVSQLSEVDTNAVDATEVDTTEVDTTEVNTNEVVPSSATGSAALVKTADTVELKIPLIVDESTESNRDALVKNNTSNSFVVVSSEPTQTETLQLSPVDWSTPIASEFSGTVPPVEPIAQAPEADADNDPNTATSTSASDLIQTPLVTVQGGYLLQGSDSSARARITGTYAFSSNVLVGATVDLTTGDAFSDSRQEGLNLNELYVAISPEGVPGLRFTLGLLDLTSYFDRNSFAKDSLTHFFNPVFQTNPALAATGIASRPSVLVTWNATDNLEIKAAGFSSSRDLGELDLNGFAGEVGLRFGNFILRGTYVTNEDAGQEDGFREIFGISRGDDDFGLLTGDREDAFGLNAELFIPELNLGLFGRYGRYENRELDRGGDTFSFGMNLLDLFLPNDRLGLGYGRQLSNNDLRQDDGDEVPDVLELFYDVRLTPNLRMGVTLQERNGFSETILGFRVRADFDLLGGR
ncbi:MAG: porin [Leptolyngbyaceae cyanobacterium SL_7_1]|nr:porin [Leptolyngbyaceae cyanobacterium SL_7_1]